MSEKKLPKGWKKTVLGKVSSWSSGGTPSRGVSLYYNGIIPWIKTGDLNDGILTESSEFISEEGLKNSSAKLFPKDSVAMAMYGATIGKVAILGIEASTNQACAVAKPSDLIINKFLFYFLKSQKREFVEKGKGGAQPNISLTVIKNHAINLPPLPEQQRIVAKLDALFGHLDSLKEKLDRIPKLLKSFRQQVLTQAVTGELTKEWREGKGLGEWEERLLKEICISITDGDHQAPPKAERGIPFLVISDISNGEFDLNRASRFVPNDYYQSLKESRKPKKNDILYTVTGSIGIPVLLKESFAFTFQRHIGIIRPDSAIVNPKYLFYTLMSELCLSQGRNAATGTAQLTIPLGGLRKYNIPYPKINEQEEIVRRVDALFELADKIETRYQSLKANIDQLPQAILAKAFRGELVGQEVKEYVVEAGEVMMAAEGMEAYKVK